MKCSRVGAAALCTAILLIWYGDEALFCSGLLHPAPNHPIDYRVFGRVPFVRVAKWPPEAEEIETEYVIGEVSEYKHPFSPIVLTDEELG